MCTGAPEQMHVPPVVVPEVERLGAAVRSTVVPSSDRRKHTKEDHHNSMRVKKRKKEKAEAEAG